VTSTGAGQGWIEPVRPMPQFGVQKIRTAVSVQVSGRVARVEVEEWFRNNGGGGLGEADYLYPLPSGAVFNNFSLFQGDKELRGETLDADKARAIYEDIVRRKKDPALIELAGHGLLRSRVFPIAPGETRKITLRYTQVLSRAGDALQFKYAAGIRQPGERRPDSPLPVQREVGIESFTMVIDDANSFGNPFSPTHEVNVQRSGRRITVRPDEALSGDLELFLPITRGLVGMTVVSHRPSSEPGFFMLTLSPGNADAPAVARDVTAVVDVSGSMSGEKMLQARNALEALLQSLSERDRFRLIAFSDQVRSYRREWTVATRTAVEEASDWIQRLQAEGGTNIAGALNEAFEAESPASRVPFVIFITDGLPSIGEQNPERIAAAIERTRGRARVFAFGVGYDVNTYLLDRLSAAARGSTQYVQPNEDVERAISRLAQKIQRPVLTDLRIANAPGRLQEIYPRQLPDLFAGEELVVFGRYDGRTDLRGAITITGQRAGRNETFSTNIELPDHELDNDFIPKLWAARKVGALTQQIKLHGQNPELLEQLRQTALRYGIISEYTSYLVLEESERMNQVAVGNGTTGGFRPQNSSAPPPVSAPAAMSGQKQVQQAEASRRVREASSAADMARAEELQVTAMESRGSAQRVIAGRVFANVNGVWKESGLKQNVQVITVEPFSNAYFAVLRALPELEAVWKTLPKSITSGKRVHIAVGNGGRKDVSQQELTQLVQKFRN
jgi:Ca-activated chloride channel family protein